MSRVRPKVLVVAGVTTAVAVLGAGLAVAATSGSTIKACAAKSDGALRIAKKCKTNEKAVSWGATGPRGATGPAGATGPSDVFTHSAASTAAANLVSGTDVAAFALPAGNWLLHSDIRASVTTTAESALFCTFSISNAVKGSTFSTAVAKSTQAFTAAVLPVSATIRLTEPSTALHLFCRNTDGAAGISPSSITATRVGKLTPEPAAQTFVTP